MTTGPITRVLTVTAACGLAFVSPGCSEKKSHEPTARERQDRALKDPFGYKPDWSDTGVSGGGTSGLDKDGLRKDLKHVLDP